MAFYIVTGKLGSGKSLVSVSRIKEHLMNGLRVATNLDLFVENMLPPHLKRIDLIRLPDLPNVDDLNNLGKGSDHFADESKFGLLVLDEGSGNFNAREWADKSRQAMIDWLKHARKLRWHVYIILQSQNMLDKQIRDAFGEHLVVCKRMDRLAIPILSLIGKLFSLNIRPPRIHLGVVRYGLGINDPIVDRWFYRGTDLYKAYDTEQVFDRSSSPAIYSYLPPFLIKGFLMNKFQIAKYIAASYLASVFLLGVILTFMVSWWIFKGSKNTLVQNGASSFNSVAAQNSTNELNIEAIVFQGDMAICYLSDGRVFRTSDYLRDAGGLRVKLDNKWVYYKNG